MAREAYKFLIGKEGLAARLFGIRKRDLERIRGLFNENAYKGFLYTSVLPTDATNLNSIQKYTDVKGRNISAGLSADHFDLERFYADIHKSKYHIIEMGFAGEARKC